MKIYLGNQPENRETAEEQKKITETVEKSGIGQALEKELSENRFGDMESAKKVRRDFLYEDKSKRDEHAKHYVNNSGTTTAIYSGKAVHYFDAAENRLKDIDNALTESGDSLETVANSFKTSFKKNSADGTVYELTKGKNKVRLISRDLAANGNKEIYCVCEENNSTASRVAFNNVKNNVDIRYTVDSDRVKEDIIVRAKADSYEYDFSINIENLEVGVSEDGKTLQLKDKESGEIKFYIPAPFMIDAAGKYSDLVYYEIDSQSDTILNLKVVADNTWMNAEEREFPVTIDPQIVSYNTDTPILSYECFERKERTGSGGKVTEYWAKKKVESYVEIDANTRLKVHINKRTINLPKKNIISAKLKVICLRGGNCYVNGVPRAFAWREFENIDITEAMKSYDLDYTVEFTNTEGNGFVDIDLDEAEDLQLEIEYIENQVQSEKSL